MMSKSDKTVIYLIGFMGSGKSTVGRLLATNLGYDFVDTDEAIVQETGMSINDIFNNHGEEHFRNLEHNLLKKLCKGNRTVVSTGGGLPMFNDNMKLIKDNGVSVYISTGLRTILDRLKHDSQRPLLKSHNPQSLALLLRKRVPTYLLSDFKVQGHRSPDLIVRRIIALLKFSEA
jgi:shikimate kinase